MNEELKKRAGLDKMENGKLKIENDNISVSEAHRKHLFTHSLIHLNTHSLIHLDGRDKEVC